MCCEVIVECCFVRKAFQADVTNESPFSSVGLHAKPRLLLVSLYVESEGVCRGAVFSTQITKVSLCVLNNRAELYVLIHLVDFASMFLHVGLACLLAAAKRTFEFVL